MTVEEMKAQFVKMFFPIYKQRYDWGWLTKEQLRSYVPDLYLTEEGYEEITGEPFKKQD